MAKSRNDEGPVTVEISADMRSRFRTLAPAALARRTPAVLRGQMYAMAQWFVVGVFGLLGLYVWRWAPIGLLILFLAGLYSGLFVDFIKYFLFRKRLERVHEQLSDDRMVWAIAEADMRGKDRIRADAMQTTHPGMAVTVDLYAGGFAALILYFGLKHLDVDLIDAIRAEDGLRWALIAVVVLPWVSLFEALVQTRGPDGYDSVQFQAGGRGGGLLVVVIVFMFLAESRSAIHKLMVFINSGTVIVSLIGALGLWLMWRERQWLAAQLSAPTSGAPAKPGKRRR